ncbi:class I SAM-dependent DNA methyltransferase [Clostridium uliginosum]|uniref:Ubiquinone/menaquinone biosynthesis C-methylase UbiE n=1 Tax=Clostridium uliginosum TaxID=119641 RepID=A0A1I1NWC5_9CLOT|nr:class I SAM-dependent methyltransferase [Clostridium uliginosum]SFD01847.1 Ubiquinone/menaquinone biosynthesis C-methylase UbiE [Clostridium uliginosum]
MSFDDYAKTWDTDKRINRAKIIADEISNSIDIDKNYSAMEFGCGTGLVSFNLYDKFKRITLIDSSKGMIDILNSKINKYKVNNMVTNHLDISDENSLDMKFDVIYNSMVLHHIHNTEAIIKNFYKLLNKNGYLCIVDLDEEDGSFHKKYPDFDGHNGFNQEELKSILINAGFNDIESKTFYYDEKIIEGQKVKYSLFLMKARKYTNS